MTLECDVLGISGTLTVLVVGYQTLLVVTEEEDAMWSSWWVFQAFWHLLYYVVLLSLVVLWRPTSNNTRYAYAAAEDIEMIASQRSTKKGEAAIDTGAELHLDLDKFSSAFLDNEEEKQEQLNKMQ